MKLALALMLTLQAPPDFHIHDLLIEGEIQRPQAFVVVSPPAELGLREAGSGPLAPARAAIIETRRAYEAAFDAWSRQGQLDLSSEPPTPDYRAALVMLDAVRDPSVAREQLALVAWLTSEPGPAADSKRATAALSALAPLAKTGPLGQWARLTLAEGAFAEADMVAAKRWYSEAQAADPASAMSGYLRFKLAWVHLNLNEATEAMALLEALTLEKLVISPDAESSLIMVYGGRAEHVGRAITFFAKHTGTRATNNLLDLARAYADVGLEKPAHDVLAAIAKRKLTPAETTRMNELAAQLRP